MGAGKYHLGILCGLSNIRAFSLRFNDNVLDQVPTRERPGKGFINVGKDLRIPIGIPGEVEMFGATGNRDRHTAVLAYTALL